MVKPFIEQYKLHYPEASPAGNWLSNPILHEITLQGYRYLLGSSDGEWECIGMLMDSFDPVKYEDNFITLMNAIKPRVFFTSIRKGIVYRIDPYRIQRSAGYTIHTLGMEGKFIDWRLSREESYR